MELAIEPYLHSIIYPDLEKGRPNWDMPHTIAVVNYVKKIIKANPGLHLDVQVMVIAATAHDWGYSDLFEVGVPVIYDEIAEKKDSHMKIGALKTEHLLAGPMFDYLTIDQKSRIVHLVSVHDQLRCLSDIDELILMEADTLGAADSTATRPTYTRSEDEKWCENTKQERASRFITDYSKFKLIDLLKLRDLYFELHSL